MDTDLYDFGMIGLGVMGRNFLLNVADHGFSAVGLDLDAGKVESLEREADGRRIAGTTSTESFVGMLRRPRRIMLLVPAGKAVDAVVESLLPFLESGDLIIDGGNSYFLDTRRRSVALREKGLHFIGAGISGGAKGARFGPSIMPGGDRTAYELVRPIFEAVAAKVRNEPCVAHMGRAGAGHFVKMVHNGIEYGLMQLIAEAYDLLRRAGGLSNEELHQTFRRWNEGKLQSFLIEITTDIFRYTDPETGHYLIDLILDKAQQKGTGKWTSQNAMDLGIPLPTIDAAVCMRGLSALKTAREQAAEAYPVAVQPASIDKLSFIDQVENALYFSFLVTYAQGMSLLSDASREHEYVLDLESVARIWRGGCIIRAGLLENIRKAYTGKPDLTNLLLAEEYRKELQESHPDLRAVIKVGIDTGIPLLAMSSALMYFDAFRSRNLPLNLVQAQRDYFGAHTYERVDREGVFHTDW